MESLTVRISRSTHAVLRALAEETDQSMTEILDKAIEIYRRQRFLAGLNADFAALRKNKAAWARRTRRAKAMGRRAHRRFGGLTADGDTETGSW